MEIEIKSRTIEFAAKILEDIFSEDAPNLAVEISAHKEKGVTLSAGYAGCCVTLPLATARVIEPGVGVANLGGLLAAFLALPHGEIAVATDSKPGMIVFSSGVRMRLDMPVGTVTRPCGVVLRGNERCAVVDTSALLHAINEVRHAMATGADRPSLNSFRLEISDDLCLAAAGMSLCDPACRIRCETDYLAISGATFPDVPSAELDSFNKKTLKPVMTEADEFNRYRLIATFFHRRPSCR